MFFKLGIDDKSDIEVLVSHSATCCLAVNASVLVMI